ncbi:MAG: hypothetical protein ACRDRX_15850 [Pseudonocardiaceae bacterium]
MTRQDDAGRGVDPASAAAAGSATRGPWRDSPWGGLPCVRFPLSSAGLVGDGLRPQLPPSWARQVPDPLFPRKTPAGRPSSTPASIPDDQPVPHLHHQTPSAGHQLQPRGARLPIRVPGAYLHPQLRRPPVTGHSGGAASST